MQAMKFLSKILGATAIASVLFFSAACSKKTPEQLEAERNAKISLAVKTAQVMMLEGKNNDAIALMENTAAENGYTFDLCQSLAYAYVEASRHAEAAIQFEKASTIKSGDAEMLFYAARYYEHSGAYSSASACYEKYLQLKPLDMVAWKALAKSLVAQEKHMEALNAYLAAVKNANRNPNTSEAAEIGVLYLKIGNKVQARSWLEAAYAATSEDNLEVLKMELSAMVDLYLAENDMPALQKAVEHLDKIDRSIIDKKHPKLREQIAEFNKSLQEAKDLIEKQNLEKQAKEKAEKEAAEKAELEKKQAEEENRKALKEKAEKEAAKKAEKEAKEKSDAKKAAEESIQEVELKDVAAEESPEQKAERLSMEAYSKIAEGDARGANKLANSAVSEYPKSHEAWRALAKSYEALGDRQAAYIISKEALDRNPDDIDATLYFLRSASFVVSNEVLLNLLYSEREKFPHNPEITIGLARTYNVVGDYLNAKFFYKTFLDETSPEHPLYTEMEEEYDALLNPPTDGSKPVLKGAFDGIESSSKTPSTKK